MSRILLFLSIIFFSITAFADNKPCNLEDCPIPTNFDYLIQGKVHNEDDRQTLIDYYKNLEHSRQVLMYDVMDAHAQGFLTEKTFNNYKAFLAWSDKVQYQTPLKDWPKYQAKFDSWLNQIQTEINKDLNSNADTLC